MPSLDVPDLGVVSYEDYGRGPLVLLVHGSPGNARAWQRVGERLADRFRVIAPNLPGYGETTSAVARGREGNGFGAELIEALLERLGPPLVLTGYSYGGALSLAILLRGRVRPAGVALVEPVAVPILETVGDAEGYAASRAVLEEYIRSFEAGEATAVSRMVDYWFGAGTYAQMPAVVKDYLHAHTGHNVRDVQATFMDRYPAASLRALSMPVVIACGARSPEVMHRICAALATQVPRASVVQVERANHAMTTTHAEEVAALIADLADRCSADGTAR